MCSKDGFRYAASLEQTEAEQNRVAHTAPNGPGYIRCLSALLGGISEPTTYGICYKMVRPYYAYLITALSTAVLAGLLHLKCYAFGGYSLTNILLYLGPNLDYANFRNALLLVGFMLIMSFITVNLIGFDDSCYEETAVAAQDAAE